MANTITVVGLGAGDLGQIPYGVYKLLKETDHVFLRTKEHPVVEELKKEGLEFQSFDHLYEQEEQFENVYEEIVHHLWRESEYRDLIYAVPGHPLVAEHTVQLLLEGEKDRDTSIELRGGQSFLDAMFQALRIDPIEGFQLLDGTVLTAEQPNIQQHVIIAQIYDSMIASDVKLSLMERYPDDQPVHIVTAAGSEGESIVSVPLFEMDRHVEVNNLTAVYVEPVRDSTLLSREFSQLRNVIRTLRGPNGCPWDKKQTHESLRKYLLEEAYEVIEAIDNMDDEHLTEELGDVLLQVMLHAQIGEDNGYFSIDDVVKSLTDKMVRRHPHVFGDESLDTAEEVKQTWDEIKKAEKAEDPQQNVESILDGLDLFPALIRAQKLQEKAAKVGFDWDDIEPILQKINEELAEFEEAAKSANQNDMEDELGDCLFALVNLSRYYGIDPELALSRTNRKFYNRFRYIEEELKKNDVSFEHASLEEMDFFWEQAKKMSKKKDSH
ncbi:nucleoside triphosphate pyrophosphohydrolase [Pseudalkalibacillus salsuginis]|uniref:nucleoside triphosphate pyrophosphohydrolase n=1 Tax=Pseudalkalibacillus salsuginis TaxID=2910972 RepID=UPI001F413DB6|nr:nucleoside triphosphate pyrophosphohydrolase [Pseudalkalibacillus salsuginis]MCF6411915.1 nucleoside triphosphate pyrophosphohydrolase [Pseudalkalibacillus salsuginis]